MPGILRDFLVAAISIVTSVVLATLGDSWGVSFALPGAILLVTVAGIDNSAYIELPTLTWGDAKPLSHYFTDTRVYIPHSVPITAALIFVTIKTVTGTVAAIRGNTKGLEEATRAILVAMALAVVFVVAVNVGGGLVHGAGGAHYQANMQYAIPSVVARSVRVPTVFFLTELALNALPLPLERRAFQIPTTTLYTYLGIAAVIQILSSLTTLLHAIRLVFWVLALALGRWLTPAAFLIVALSPLLMSVPKTVRRLFQMAVGLCVTGMLVFPLLNVATGGVVAALPAISARLSAITSARLVQATSLLFQPATNFNAAQFCQALSLQPCNLSPTQPMPEAVRDKVMQAYFSLAKGQVALLALEWLSLAISGFAFAEASFMGRVIGATAVGLGATGSFRSAIQYGWSEGVAMSGRIGRMNQGVVSSLGAMADKITTPRVSVEVGRKEEGGASKRQEKVQKMNRLLGIASTAALAMGRADIAGGLQVVSGIVSTVGNIKSVEDGLEVARELRLRQGVFSALGPSPPSTPASSGPTSSSAQPTSPSPAPSPSSPTSSRPTPSPSRPAPRAS